VVVVVAMAEGVVVVVAADEVVGLALVVVQLKVLAQVQAAAWGLLESSPHHDLALPLMIESALGQLLLRQQYPPVLHYWWWCAARGALWVVRR
jgi:hypothetical protein